MTIYMFSYLKNIIQLIPSEMFHAFKFYLQFSNMELKLRWSNTSVIKSNRSTQLGRLLNLLINISNSYLNNKLSFI